MVRAPTRTMSVIFLPLLLNPIYTTIVGNASNDYESIFPFVLYLQITRITNIVNKVCRSMFH